MESPSPVFFFFFCWRRYYNTIDPGRRRYRFGCDGYRLKKKKLKKLNEPMHPLAIPFRRFVALTVHNSRGIRAVLSSGWKFATITTLRTTYVPALDGPGRRVIDGNVVYSDASPFPFISTRRRKEVVYFTVGVGGGEKKHVFIYIHIYTTYISASREGFFGDSLFLFFSNNTTVMDKNGINY